MTTNELRELDAWIAENVFGAHIFKSGRGSICARFHSNTNDEYERIIESRHPWDGQSYNPTQCPMDAMDVLKKCAERRVIIELFINVQGKWTCGTQSVEMGSYQSAFSESETAELSICLFAKQLFSQTTK